MRTSRNVEPLGRTFGNEHKRVTKKIDVPKNWPALVAKYTDVVPRYAKQ